MRLILRAISGVRFISGRRTHLCSKSTRPRMVSVTARGCSKFSFCMKLLYSSLAALTWSQGSVWISGLPGLKEHHLACVFQNGGDVRGDEHLAIPDTDGHPARVADAAGDDAVRLPAAHRNDGLRALKLREGRPRRLLQRHPGVDVALQQM